MKPRKLSEKELMGTWKLVEYFIVNIDGKKRRPWKKTNGLLVYNRNRTMIVMIKKALGKITINDLICYFGKFRVKSPHVLHYVFDSSLLRYRKTVQVRRAILRKTTLTLIHESHHSGNQHVVTWKKIISKEI